MSDMNCPYCDAEQEVCHDDGHGYEEVMIIPNISNAAIDAAMEEQKHG